MSGLGKPIAFHAVKPAPIRFSRAYWIEQAIGGFVILNACVVLFTAIALAVSLFTANMGIIVAVATILTLPWMIGAHYLLYRLTIGNELKRRGQL